MKSFIFGKKEALMKSDKCIITLKDSQGLVDKNLGRITIDLGSIVGKPREDAWLPVQVSAPTLCLP